ncbi:hypothetical protein ACFSJ3_03340 [Corallincola platygyrae]|uniref:Uncharacterized protein n=1 Tax=Corallincola platygyrae TaxID=1193278 RepID=A0ABW4XK54_9GAMM
MLLKVYKSEEVTGFFRKKTIASYWAPAYLKCPECGAEKLIFDPRKHGWDGEMGEDCSITEQGQLTSFSDTPGKVYVCCTFQGAENYEELVSEGVKNPQDYFDTFSLWFGQSPECVFEYECA